MTSPASPVIWTDSVYMNGRGTDQSSAFATDTTCEIVLYSHAPGQRSPRSHEQGLDCLCVYWLPVAAGTWNFSLPQVMPSGATTVKVTVAVVAAVDPPSPSISSATSASVTFRSTDSAHSPAVPIHFQHFIVKTRRAQQKSEGIGR